MLPCWWWTHVGSTADVVEYIVKRSSMPNEVHSMEFGTTVARNVFAIGDASIPVDGGEPMSAAINPMSQLRITKVCVNIGVGEGGERLVNAENVLELVTGVKPQRTLGRIQNRDLKVREGAPIGCKATMRNKDASTRS